MCPQPDLNRHTKALAIELQGHVRLAVCTTIVIICEVYRTLSHRPGATRPSGAEQRTRTSSLLATLGFQDRSRTSRVYSA